MRRSSPLKGVVTSLRLFVNLSCFRALFVRCRNDDARFLLRSQSIFPQFNHLIIYSHPWRKQQCDENIVLSGITLSPYYFVGGKPIVLFLYLKNYTLYVI